MVDRSRDDITTICRECSAWRPPRPCLPPSPWPTNLLGQEGEDALEGRSEAHFQELIGFVEHESVQLLHIRPELAVREKVD